MVFGMLSPSGRSMPTGNGWFQWTNYDRKTGEYEFGSYNNAKLRIYPVTDAKK